MSAKIERRTLEDARLETRDAGDGQPMPKIVGYASVFNVETILCGSPTLIVKEVIRPGAFARAIAEGQDVRALVDHDSSLLIGRTRSGTCVLKEDDHGLSVIISPPNTTVARDLIENLRSGNLTGMSFAFIPRSNGETITTTVENGVTIQFIEVTDVDLVDVSIVTFPQYVEASASVRSKALAKQVKEAWLKSRRLELDRLSALASK